MPTTRITGNCSSTASWARVSRPVSARASHPHLRPAPDQPSITHPGSNQPGAMPATAGARVLPAKMRRDGFAQCHRIGLLVTDLHVLAARKTCASSLRRPSAVTSQPAAKRLQAERGMARCAAACNSAAVTSVLPTPVSVPAIKNRFAHDACGFCEFTENDVIADRQPAITAESFISLLQTPPAGAAR